MSIAMILLRTGLLALTLWGGYILLVKTAHKQSLTATNIAWPAFTGALFAAAMGWLA